jgi:hypothetical protein
VPGLKRAAANAPVGGAVEGLFPAAIQHPAGAAAVRPIAMLRSASYGTTSAATQIPKRDSRFPAIIGTAAVEGVTLRHSLFGARFRASTSNGIAAQGTVVFPTGLPGVGSIGSLLMLASIMPDSPPPSSRCLRGLSTPFLITAAYLRGHGTTLPSDADEFPLERRASPGSVCRCSSVSLRNTGPYL